MVKGEAGQEWWPRRPRGQTPDFVVKVGQNGGLSMGNWGKRRVKDVCRVSSLETEVFVLLSKRRVTREGTGLADKEGIKHLAVSSFTV